MTLLFCSLLAFTFIILGGFHFYWLFGGVWGIKYVIPTKNKEANSLAIPPFATLIVALALVSMGLLYLIKAELITLPIPNWIITFSYWFVPSIFTLRAIGEFNYVGFFKKIKQTEFGKMDTKFFSPLCLAIGSIGFLLIFLGN
jgi:hypothetical protein